MSTYNKSFTPGHKSNLRKYIAQTYLKQYYGITNIDTCLNVCIQPQVNL